MDPTLDLASLADRESPPLFVSDCCGAAVVPARHGDVCRRCGRVCDVAVS